MADDGLTRMALLLLERKRAIRRTALAAALNLWDELAFPDNPDPFLDAAVPRHTASLNATSQLVDSFVDAFLAAHGVEGTGAALDHDKVARAIRGGTPIDEVFERAFAEARRHLATDGAYDAAMSRGRDRLGNMVGTDVQQAFRLGMRDRMAAEPAIPGYRRVLVGPENCLLCVAASTAVYKSDRLMPIHPGCDCSVAPLPPGTPVRGTTIQSELPTLDSVKATIREQGVRYTDRAGMSNLKVNTDELRRITEWDHGELGPLLKASQHRTSTVRWRRRSRREFNDVGSLIRS